MDIGTIGGILGFSVAVYGIYKGISSSFSRKGEKHRNEYSLINSYSELREKSNGRYIILVFDRVRNAFPSVRKRFENDILLKILESNKEFNFPVCWSNVAENDLGPWLDKKIYGIKGCLLIKNGTIESSFFKHNYFVSGKTIVTEIELLFNKIRFFATMRT